MCDQATPEMIEKAVDDTVPRVAPMFWSFRIMVGLGFAMLLLFGLPSGFAQGRLCRTSPGCCARPCGCCHAVDRLRAGLVRGRVRPPALDHLRRAAHPSERVHAQRGEPVRLAGRLHRLLHRAAGGRDVPDGQVRRRARAAWAPAATTNATPSCRPTPEPRDTTCSTTKPSN
jgi:hypothetical protein